MSRCVYVVDDDDAIRSELIEMLESRGAVAQGFPDGEALVEVAEALPRGCVILDLAMPGRHGLDVQRELMTQQLPHQVIMLTGQGNIAAAVAAMRAGASDFLEKPFSARKLFAALEAAFGRMEEEDLTRRTNAEAAALLVRLSPRESEVLAGLLEGLPNKLIAYRLGLSTRTVEVYRGHVMAKLEVRSLSEAVRIAIAGNLAPLGHCHQRTEAPIIPATGAQIRT